MCIMHPKYKSTPATNSCNRGGFIRKGVLTLPAPFFTQLQINLWSGIFYECMLHPWNGPPIITAKDSSGLPW